MPHPSNARRSIALLVLLAVAVAAVALWVFLQREKEPVLGEKPAPIPAPAHEGLALGKQLYERHCLSCHGETGDGKGPAAVFLYPKPRNFRLAQSRLVTTLNRVPSDEDLLNVVTRGMPGSAMFPFGHLSEADRRALIGHVRELTRAGVEERIRKGLADAGEEVDPAQLATDIDRFTKPGQVIELPARLPAADADSLARGKALYVNQCATCHGDTGKGDGGKEQRDEDGTPTRPRDFTRGIFKGGRDRHQLYARIALGMPGTPMPASPQLKPEEIADMVNFVQSFSGAEAQSKVEHKRATVIAKRAPTSFSAEISEEEWRTAPATPIVVSPLWWREYAEPDLKVQALHDGQTLAIRLSWNDVTRSESTRRPEDFEDMGAVQLFKGQPEPFLGMGAESGKIDIWLWRAGWQRTLAAADNQLDDYPFDTPFYRDLFKAKGKTTPDQLTARAAGNQLANADRGHGGSSLTAKGFGSTTFRLPASQRVTAKATWRDGRWNLVLQRPLQVKSEDGLPLAAGERCSVAFAVWDGAAQDRNGQKLISIWHDLQVE